MNIVDHMQIQFWKQHHHRYELLAPNLFTLDGKNEMDLFAVRKSAYCDEIEIKLTATDFAADFAKTSYTTGKFPRLVNKHEGLANGELLPNYFAFFVPAELEGSIDVPEYAGLYTFNLNRFKRANICCRKTAPILHRRKIPLEYKYRISRGLHFRYWQQLNRRADGQS